MDQQENPTWRHKAIKLVITEYVHAYTDEFANWELELGEEYMESEAARLLHHRLCEVEVKLEVDTETGEDRILEVRYGNQVLKPVENADG